jgi:uncharacterized membrane protein
MEIAHRILLMAHVLSATLWIGAVFMGAIVDWPAARLGMKAGKFPFAFIVGQGSRVFPYVYFGIITQLVTSIGLYFIHPAQEGQALGIVIVKSLCLALMTAFTLYGTFSTWPKLQLATDGEAFRAYRNYIRRAYATCTAGLVATCLGVVLNHFVARGS